MYHTREVYNLLLPPEKLRYVSHISALSFMRTIESYHKAPMPYIPAELYGCVYLL